MNFRAFVFDLDGTLVDSRIDFDSMKAELRLSQEADVLEYVERLEPIARQKAFDIIYRHELAGAKTSRRIQGALEFVESAKAAGTPCAIFTRNTRSITCECLREHGFDIDVVVAREDSPPKPKPDGLLKIAKNFGVHSSEILFIGDYIYDLQAGLAAGTPTALFLPSPPDFDVTGAHFTFETYQQLKDRIFPERKA